MVRPHHLENKPPGINLLKKLILKNPIARNLKMNIQNPQILD